MISYRTMLQEIILPFGSCMSKKFMLMFCKIANKTLAKVCGYKKYRITDLHLTHSQHLVVIGKKLLL